MKLQERHNKIFSVVIIVMMIFGIVVVPTATGRDNNSTVFADMYNGIKINSTGDSNTKQYTECTLSFEVKNTQNTSFTYDGAKLVFSKNEGLQISGGDTATVTLGKKDDKANISFNVKTSRFCDVGSRDYMIVLTKGGETVYESRYFYLNIDENIGGENPDGPQVATVDIQSSILPESGFKTGKGNSISFKIYNGGNTSIKNAQLQLVLPDGIAIDNAGTVVGLGTVGLGKVATASFPILIEKGMDSKSYVLTAKLTGLDSKNGNIAIERAFYIPVTGTGKVTTEGAAKTPQLMISDYQYGGTYVQAGTNFPLTLKIYNTSKVDLANIKVTVASSDGTFVPVKSSNSFYVEGIGARGIYENTMIFSAKPDAEQKAMGLTVSMSYEDKDGNQFKAEDSISIPVTQKTKLVVDNIVPPYEVYAGNSGSATVDFYNMGKTTLSNLRVNAEGNFDVMESNSYYGGNMASGKSDSYTFTFIPREVGPMTGTVKFTYEDATGGQQMIQIPFSFEAVEMPVTDDQNMGEPVPEKPKMPWKWIGGMGVVVVGAIGTVIWRKRKKAKAERALDIEDAEFEVADIKDTVDETEKSSGNE